MSFIDARTLPRQHRIESDVCVVGSGAAGLALASEFLNGSHRVAVLESGGFQPDPEIQSLYDGGMVGQRDFPLTKTRLRYFGGTTNHWTAWVRPLDPIDFARRPWVSHSGWPFGRSELEPFYDRARRFLGLPPHSFDVRAWKDSDNRPWNFEEDRVTTGVLQIVAEKDRRLGPVLRGAIDRARNVAVHLYATVLEIVVDGHQKRVRRLRVTTSDGKTLTARARYYVLAAGGIENARILLLSSGVASAGVGNQNGLVGRFFGNHPEMRNVAELQLSDPGLDMSFYRSRPHQRGTMRGFLTLSEGLQRKLRLPNCWIRLLGPIEGPRADFDRHVARAAAGVDRFATPARREGPAGGPLPSLGLTAIAESAPNPDSRVRLGDETDRLGQRRVVLDWRLSELDSIGVRRTIEALAREVGASGVGRVRSRFPQGGFSSVDPRGSFHHMGTTRMHDDPKQGVVDPNCRVHGISNLFVAGSSVFPTYGTANPTFTILALTFRLADHLRGVLA